MSFSSDNPQITNQLPLSINLPDITDDADLFQERLEDLLQNMSNAVNSKIGGLYTLNETSSSAQYFMENNTGKFRNVYRKTFDLVQENAGNIDPSEAVNFPHNMQGVRESAGIFANCTATDGRIFTCVFPDVWVDETSVYFTNPINVELSQCDVVADILKEE